MTYNVSMGTLNPTIPYRRRRPIFNIETSWITSNQFIWQHKFVIRKKWILEEKKSLQFGTVLAQNLSKLDSYTTVSETLINIRVSPSVY